MKQTPKLTIGIDLFGFPTDYSPKSLQLDNTTNFEVK